MSGDDLFLAAAGSTAVAAAAALWRLRERLHPARGPSRPLVLLVNALVTVLLVASVVVAGEIHFRFVHDSTESFGLTKTSEKWVERHWRENGDGVRDDIEYPNRRTPGVRRITFVGDSFTAAQGVSDVEDRFVNILRRRHPEWEVHMLALPGMDTGEQVDFLGTWIANGYEIEDVVLVYCLNDLSDLVPDWVDRARRFQRAWAERSWLRRSSYLFDALAYRLELRRDTGLSGYFDFVEAAYHDLTWAMQAKRLDQLHRTVADHRGRLFVVTFPFLHTLGDRYPLRDVHAQLAAFWSARGVRHLDLLPAFEKRRPNEVTVNPRDAHPNPAAHRIAADAIDEFLSERLALTIPPPPSDPR